MSIPTLRVYPPDTGGVREGLQIVLRGSYDVPGLTFDLPPTILDLGAHVGSFSVWAASRFPGARIFAFEPHPTNASFCRQNTEGLGVEVNEFAVVGSGTPDAVVLHDGKNNTGQRSIHMLGEQRPGGVSVKTFFAKNLPPADILKADTEGCEMDILREYPHLAGVRVIMLEWHRQEDYREFLRWLPTLGFQLVRDDAKGRWQSDRNIIFVRKTNAVAAAVEAPVAPTSIENAPAAEGLFQCPRTSIDMIASLYGEYDLQPMPDLQKPFVLDVGGHVGGFAWYALKRWPTAQVLSSSPTPTRSGFCAATSSACRSRLGMRRSSTLSAHPPCASSRASTGATNAACATTCAGPTARRSSTPGSTFPHSTPPTCLLLTC